MPISVCQIRDCWRWKKQAKMRFSMRNLSTDSFSMGGLIGLAIGYGLGTLISSSIPSFPPASIPLWSVALALGFSGFVGVLFGILPAAKAANLDPIDALRYE